MKITTVLFDLDGTLLPLDQDEFIRSYGILLAKRAATLGYKPEAFGSALMKAVGAVMKNGGQSYNEEVFWSVIASELGEGIEALKDVTDDFYRNEFQSLKALSSVAPEAKELISHLKASGIRIALATMPLFPYVATEARIRWAGLDPSDFEYITTYENSKTCKPNLKYYLEVAKALNVPPESCIMIGNDVHDDMPAEQTGMKVFLLTDCLINRGGADISAYPHGSFEELKGYLKKII